MPGRVLLDTKVLVALLRGDPSLRDELREIDEAFTSIVVLGELLYGARRSAQMERNRASLDSLMADLTALPCDRLTAEVYSRLKVGLLWVARRGTLSKSSVPRRPSEANSLYMVMPCPSLRARREPLIRYAQSRGRVL